MKRFYILIDTRDVAESVLNKDKKTLMQVAYHSIKDVMEQSGAGPLDEEELAQFLESVKKRCRIVKVEVQDTGEAKAETVNIDHKAWLTKINQHLIRKEQEDKETVYRMFKDVYPDFIERYKAKQEQQDLKNQLKDALK